MAVLFIFSGLPGCGKTTLSKHLAQSVSAVHLRIDTIEQALRDLCNMKVEGEGYRLAYRVAADNLRLGMSVIADSCNPIELTRVEWEQVAGECGARFINVEILCSDRVEHQQRVDARHAKSCDAPAWKDVESRRYERWSRGRVVIDTAGRTIAASVSALIEAVRLELAADREADET